MCLVSIENWVKQKLISALTIKYPSQAGNEFQFLFYLQMNSRTHRQREREGDSKKREHRWFAQPSSSIVHRSLITAQPSFNTNTHHQSLISTHPSLITDPQTPKTHLFDRQPCTDGYRLSSNLDNRPQVVLQRRHHLDWSLASCSCCHHPRPILFSTHPRPLSSPPLKTDLSFPIYLSFPQSLNLSLLDLWFFLLLLWWCGRWCFGGFCVVWIAVDFLWVLVCRWWWIFCGCWCVGGGGFSVGVGVWVGVDFLI